MSLFGSSQNLAESAQSKALHSRLKDWSAWDAEPRGHSHQVGKGIGLHLLHYFAAVGLHCDLTDAELPTNLFIQQARDNQRHNLPFATGRDAYRSRSCCISPSRRRAARLRSRPSRIAFNKT